MIDLERHPYFTSYIDPETGIKSYVLTERVAEAQRHFYFVNTSLTYDSKYLWIVCSNAPARINSLAVVSLDPDNPFIRHFPGAGFTGTGNCPLILPGTHDVIFAEGKTIYKVTVDGEITKVFTLGNDVLMGRQRWLERVFTHASISADGKMLALDSYITGKTYMGVLNLETKEYKLIDVLNQFHDHVQFSPRDNDLFLIDQEWWFDPISGERFNYKNRTWLMDVNGTRFEPLIQASWFGRDGSRISHDFWSKDGNYICYNDYEKGAYECNIDTREITHVWKRPICHAHTNADRSLWVADQTPYAWRNKPCDVLLFDRETSKEIEIFSKLPYFTIEDADKAYHIDPHPAFTDDGEYIISTTTVMDRNVDVAITPVKPALQICREKGRTTNQ